MKHFVVDMFYFHSETGEVKGLTIRVCGKSDKTWIPLTLWRNDGQPWMCPVRHVLAWIQTIGHKDPEDYLIPGAKWMAEFEKGTRPEGNIPILSESTAQVRTCIYAYSHTRTHIHILTPTPTLTHQHIPTYTQDRYEAAFDCLARRGNFGLHTFRKTAYLIGSWGGGKENELGISARHESTESIRLYIKDANAVKALLKELG